MGLSSSRSVAPAALAALLALAGCGEDTFTIVVEVRTDLVPGAEFSSIDGVLSSGGAPQSVSADPTAPFLDGVRLGEWEGLEAGSYELTVRALDDTGALVVARDVRIDLRETLAVTVVLTRSCGGVTCPGSGDPPQASTCLGGRCVDPACSELDPTACGAAECTSDTDCAATVACAATACVEGACLATPDHAMCLEGETCDLELGCTGGMTCGPDGDDDGVAECMDCDDTDPDTYPGAPEVCGDGVTNDCSSSDPPETGCPIGTYVAPPPLGAPPPAGLGTQENPVDTISQAIENATRIGGGEDVYVAAGTYPEEITMVEGVSVLGGYDPTDWSRSPSANVTTINCESADGIDFPSGITRDTVLDGFVINGRFSEATSTTITVRRDAAPTISNNVINGPDANAGGSVAIRVNPWAMVGRPPASSGSPLITGNSIRLGDSAPGTASDRYAASAFGIWARDTPVEITDNRIVFVDDLSYQTAISVPFSESATITGNVIEDRPIEMEQGIGIGFFASAGDVSNNVVTMSRCITSCLGIAVGGAGGVQRVANNVVFGGSSTAGRTAALSYGYEGDPMATPVDLVVHSNFLHGGSGSTSTGIEIFGCSTVQISAGRIFNNVIYSGVGDTRYPAVEGHPLLDFAEFSNNALYLITDGSFTNGALYRDEESVTPDDTCGGLMGGFDLTTDAQVNMLTGYSGNLENDCAIVDPFPGGDFHLGPSSMCVDAGTSTEAPMTDFEGDARPMGLGYDIGPDEAM